MESRNTYAEVNVKKFLRNIFEISKRAGVPVAPVLKADAYGHGAVRLAHACQKDGIGFLIVAFLEEGIQLRKSGITLPILILNYFNPFYTKKAIEYDLSITIYSFEQMKKIVECIDQSDKLKVHLNVDTGMSRLGLDPENSLKLYKEMKNDKRFIIEGVYTHFSSADEPEDATNTKQIKKFKAFLNRIGKPRYIHVSNSAATTILNLPFGNMCRVGIASYGLQPSSNVQIDYIQPVMSIHSTVSFVKKLSKGQSVGYGHTFTANKKMKVATVPFGYADGLPRSLSNKGEVLIHSKRARILGRVSMDQIVVDVSALNDVKMGDDVIIIGESNGERISAEEVAEIAGTINYEIVCDISKRVPRIYIEE